MITIASFRKRKDKWEYRIRYKEMGRYKETSKGGFKTKKEAQLAAAKVEEKLATGGNLKDSKITFNEYLYEWLNTYKKGNFKYITFHGFRHTHAVHLLQSGTNIKYVSERLGHSSIDMTANVYLHITKSMEETAVNQYDEFLKSRGQIVGKHF